MVYNTNTQTFKNSTKKFCVEVFFLSKTFWADMQKEIVAMEILWVFTNSVKCILFDKVVQN